MARRDLQAKQDPSLARPPLSAFRAGSGPDQLPPPTLEVDEAVFPRFGEFLRKAALGSLALLFVTRAYYPSEDAEVGSGLVWVFLMLCVSGIGVVSILLSGMTQVRWSWVDAMILTLIVLVGLGAGHAADRRSAITMAWEWGALGLLYGLVRNLPRTRSESATLAGVVVTTAVADAAYGLYQIPVEFAQLRRMFLSNPEVLLSQLGIAPGTPSAESFKQRLMYSNEPFSTFALANSLAGFLVGPMALMLAVALENLKKDQRGSKWLGLIMASGPGLILLVCLLLTKSRSAYVGLGVASVVLACSYRGAIPRRWLVGSGIGVVVLLLGLIAGGVATRQLDVQILTEAKKSLGYRWEYWVGAWGVITDAPPPFAANLGANGMLGAGPEDPTTRTSRTFWWGVGPANFAGPYLRHKLPEASEEIQDPHNLILEVWAESGVFAMIALVASLFAGVGLIFSPIRTMPGSDPSSTKIDRSELSSKGNNWLWVMAGMGWFGVWVLGELNPVTQKDMLMRWLILGAAWLLAALMIGPIWSRRPIPAVGLGVAVIALTVHLLAAGGIGIPSVAMSLWVCLALGLNLRDDRSCGRVRVAGGLGPGVVLACFWAVLAGTFYGAVVPGWQSDVALAEGEALMAARPPAYEAARSAFTRAIELDHYAVRPWLALAELEYRFWRSPEARDRQKTSWTKVLLTFDKALEGNYRDPDNLSLRRRQASYARKILGELPEDAKPFAIVGLRGTIAKATRKAVSLYPTSAELRGELAQASADLGMYADAVVEANTALQLDTLMPHADKKLPTNIRSYLGSQIPRWDEQAKAPAPSAPKR